MRDPDAWFESTQATIFNPDGIAARALTSGEGPAAAFFKSFTGDFNARLHDRSFLIDYFCRHTEQVKAAIPPERLLIYQAGQGWAPLCEFLGAPIPETPFPSENSRAEFIGRVVPGFAGAPPNARP